MTIFQAKTRSGNLVQARPINTSSTATAAAIAAATFTAAAAAATGETSATELLLNCFIIAT